MLKRSKYIPVLLLVIQLTLTLKAQQGGTAQPAVNGVIQLSLQDAIQRSTKVAPELTVAAAQVASAVAQRNQQRAALLPNVDYTTQFTYTQPNPGGDFRFIAANAVREYLSLGSVRQDVSLLNWAEYRRAKAAEAAAKARAEIARRGLTATVVQAYFAYAAALEKQKNAKTALAEAQSFVELSSKLEAGGEVADADVVKAKLQMQDRQRLQVQADLAVNQARLDLAVLVFSSPDQAFVLADKLWELPVAAPVPATVPSTLARNPFITSAKADLAQARSQQQAAVAGYFPSLSFAYFYGIDATRFAVSDNGRRNLGYGLQATLNIPIWNWGATRSRVRASSFQVTAAKRQLSFAESRLRADIEAAVSSVNTERQAVFSLEESLKLAEQSLRLAELRYQAGETTFLEVVDAQSALSTERNTLVDTELRYRIAQANLEQLTGVLQP
jgi:outer membrane protein TolC